MGDSGVGKTKLLERFVYGTFVTESKLTIGVDTACKSVDLGLDAETERLKCQFWDTAGLERFRAISMAYYSGANGAFLVYDITRAATLANLDKWITDLVQRADKSIVLMLVGNKSDLEAERQVSQQDGMDFAEKHNMCAFFETSARNSTNVEFAFQSMAQDVYKVASSAVSREDDERRDREGDGDGATEREEAEDERPIRLAAAIDAYLTTSGSGCC